MLVGIVLLQLVTGLLKSFNCLSFILVFRLQCLVFVLELLDLGTKSFDSGFELLCLSGSLYVILSVLLVEDVAELTVSWLGVAIDVVGRTDEVLTLALFVRVERAIVQAETRLCLSGLRLHVGVNSALL